MSEIVPRATHGSPSHPLRIGEIGIPCYVLEDGRRVLVRSGVLAALGIAKGGNTPYSTGDRLSRFTGQPSLQPYLSPSVMEVIANPIEFRSPYRSKTYGYEATILVDICEAILKARDNGKLQDQQEHIAKRADTLMRGFAIVGIVALVDEATGYQKERDRDELQKILAAYISPELLPWTKRFPDEFYKEMFRLRKWQWHPLNPAQGSRYAGQLTNEIVYEKLPPGILDELQRRNPVVDYERKFEHHRLLTEEIGTPHLEKHLAVVIALMRISPNWRVFMSHFKRAFRKPNEAIQEEMDFGEEIEQTDE